jgi:hypothetical protein
MTKKDYIAFAKEMKAMHDHYSNQEMNNTEFYDFHNEYCDAIANVLAADNPRFNREKFLKACGVEK